MATTLGDTMQELVCNDGLEQEAIEMQRVA
jgi:hypothetical protein